MLKIRITQIRITRKGVPQVVKEATVPFRFDDFNSARGGWRWQEFAQSLCANALRKSGSIKINRGTSGLL